MWDVTREDGAVGILHAVGYRPLGHRLRFTRRSRGRHGTHPHRPHRRTERGHRHRQGHHRQQTCIWPATPRAACSATRPPPTAARRTSPASWRSGRRWTPWPHCRWASRPTSAAVAADFMADHVFNRIDIPGWLARTGFQMLDPLKTAKARIDFLLQLHDREALLPREQQRRFLDREGWIAWSGPAVSELLKQFIAHNRMMTGGFAINGQLVTLSDIDLPGPGVRRRGRRHRPAGVGARHQTRRARRRGVRGDGPRRALRPRRGLARGHADTWPTVADWVRWLSGLDPGRPTSRPMAGQHRRTQRFRCGPELSPRARCGRGVGPGTVAGPRRGGCGRHRQQVDADAGRRDRAHPAPADPARPDQRPHPDLAGPHHRRAGRRRAPTGSSCCSTAASTPTRRSTAVSTTSCAD